jgi:Ser/Thr protein kinase RdoA (MazF antagonist)
MNETPLSISNQFLPENTLASVIPYGSGHIHDTYRLRNADASQPDYLLQRINHRVFSRVPELMENIRRVTEHLHRKQPGSITLTLLPTRDNRNFYRDAAGNYWRMFVFIPGTHTLDVVQTPEQAYEGGKAFGQFLALLSDIPGQSLHETIPSFHSIAMRRGNFERAVAENPAGRLPEVSAEVDFVRSRVEKMAVIEQAGERGHLPKRIVHNDTKFNNVLLNADEKAVCVIDLDTVMPGYVHYDFGDAVRTIANPAAEDEADLSKITVDLQLFTGFTEGYLAETRTELTDNELRYLAFSPQLMAFIMGLRFLTDYLAGDQYYKIHFSGHNLQRARAQFQLVRQLEAHQPAMERIVRKASLGHY